MEQYEVFFLGVAGNRRCSKVPLLLVSNLSNQWGLSQTSAIQKPSSQDSLLRIKVQNKEKRQDGMGTVKTEREISVRKSRQWKG